MAIPSGAERLFHFPINRLVVPAPWPVAGCVVRPLGWLGGLIEAGSTTSAVDGFADIVRDSLKGLKEPTIEVPADTVENARARASDAVALLRLYQRARYPHVSADHQTFGLPAEIAALREDHWVTVQGHVAGLGGNWQGVLAEWTFTEADLAAYVSDERFTRLDTIIASAPSSRTEIEARIVTALRWLNLATVMLPEALRIVALATSLEALLGDEDSRDGAHRIAQRGAYLTCGLPESPHGSKRPACFFLRETSTEAVKRVQKTRYDQGVGARCSSYEGLRRLYADRNAALHRAKTSFPNRRAASHESTVDEVLLAVVRWSRHEKAALSDLDDEIEACP